LFDVTDEANTTSTLSDFEKYVDTVPDLADTLGNFSEITVFVPTNAAFEAFEKNIAPVVATNLLTGENTPMWKDHLEDLLNYHVLPIVLPSSDITDGSNEPTLNEEEIDFTLNDPTTPGDTGIFVNTDAEVVDADIDIVNGIVHVIDDVLLPPWVSKSIVDIAIDENPTKSPGGEDLDMLIVKLSEVSVADDEFQLSSILSAPGGYTVFAPTSAAFIKDESKLVDLSIDQLSSVLNYHVVEGVYPESVLVEGFTLTTLQGEELTFKSSTDTDTDGNGIVTTMVDDETIITPNILANNGIVHVIDGVLIPDG
jgi:transforming growth factor-beta-induced protein